MSYNSVVALRCPWAKEKCLALQSSGQVRHHINTTKSHILHDPYHTDGLLRRYPITFFIDSISPTWPPFHFPCPSCLHALTHFTCLPPPFPDGRSQVGLFRSLTGSSEKWTLQRPEAFHSGRTTPSSLLSTGTPVKPNHHISSSPSPPDVTQCPFSLPPALFVCSRPVGWVEAWRGGAGGGAGGARGALGGTSAQGHIDATSNSSSNAF